MGGTFQENAQRCAWTGGAPCSFDALILKGADYPEVGLPFRRRFPLSRPGWRPPESTAFPFGYQNDTINHAGFLLKGLQKKVPTNGFQALLTFAPICNSVRMFGFSGAKTFDGHVMGERHGINLEH